MKRIHRRKPEEILVERAITILEKEIEPMYGGSKRLLRMYIHKQPNNKYYKVFKKIIEYLEELRGSNKNPIKYVLKDYFICVYDYYHRFNRIPPLNNLSPNVSNKIRFEEFISNFYRNNDEEYWTQEEPEKIEIIEVPIDKFDIPNITET